MFKGPSSGLAVVAELLMHPKLTSHVCPKAPLRHLAPEGKF